MANENMLSAELSPSDFAALQDAIQVFKDKLPFLINLTPLERRAFPKMGDKSMPFVHMALDFAKGNAGLVPPYLNVAEFEKDLKLVKSLTELAQDINMLAEGLDDTIMLAGCEAYKSALVFYRSIKTAKEMNIPGIDTVHESLRKSFPTRRKSGKSTDSEQSSEISQS